MAEGYSDIPHTSYTVWKTNTLGHEYDLDGYYGCQCWDYASLFWRNVGFPAGYPLTGPNSYAYECWTVNRLLNAGTTFELITDKTAILKGDVIVLDASSLNSAGHIAFADENYNGTDTIWAIGQNQGGTPLPGGGTAVTENQIGLDKFLGAFRYKEWHQIPPVSGAGSAKFPWVLYSRKLNQRRNGVL